MFLNEALQLKLLPTFLFFKLVIFRTTACTVQTTLEIQAVHRNGSKLTFQDPFYVTTPSNVNSILHKYQQDRIIICTEVALN